MNVVARRRSLSPRRPRESGDPYTLSPWQFAVAINRFHVSRLWLWVPAFAGTTPRFTCKLESL